MLFVPEVVGDLVVDHFFHTTGWWVLGLMGTGFVILLHARVGLLDAIGVGVLIPVMSTLVSIVMVQALHLPFYGPSGFARTFPMLYVIPVWLITDAIVRLRTLRLVER